MEPVIAGHPLHPAIVPVPVGVFPASYALDVLALITGSDELAEASYYNMLIGSLGALPAALTGFLDYRQMEQNDPAHKTATTHGLLNGSLIGLYALNLLVRRKNKRSFLGFILSTIAMGGLAVSGYLGGEIAYGRGWRVRSAERFELEWQKEHKTGPFKEEGSNEPTQYPPAVVKGFEEKKSGEAVMKEIEQQADSATGEKAPKVKLLHQKASTKPAPSANVTGLGNGQNGKSATTGADNKPSQAEGDRDTIAADLGEAVEKPEPTRTSTRRSRANSGPDLPEDKPSQAEGDRDTVDADLNDQSHPPIAQG